jgi:hypothetical protein
MGQNSWVPTVRESGTRAGNRRLPAVTSTETLDAEREMWHNISYDTMSRASSSQSIRSNAADEAADSKCAYSGVTMHQDKTADLLWLPAVLHRCSQNLPLRNKRLVLESARILFSWQCSKDFQSTGSTQCSNTYTVLKQQASGSARHIWSSLGGRHVWKPSTASSSHWCPLYGQGLVANTLLHEVHASLRSFSMK